MSSFFDTFDQEYYETFRENAKVLSPDKISKSELMRANLVANDIIKNYSGTETNTTDLISYGELLSYSVNSLYEMGLCSVADKSISLLQKVDAYSLDGAGFGELGVHSSINSTGGVVAKECKYLLVPDKLFIESIPFMAHEITHIFKEMNPIECRSIYTNLEVIPITVEMISAYLSLEPDKRKNVFLEREKGLYYQAIQFRKIIKELNMEHSSLEKSNLHTALGLVVVYLNSFYYSSILFRLYFINSKLIVDLIDKVLNGEMSTNDVVEILEDYVPSIESEYQEGLDNFRKFLK